MFKAQNNKIHQKDESTFYSLWSQVDKEVANSEMNICVYIIHTQLKILRGHMGIRWNKFKISTISFERHKTENTSKLLFKFLLNSSGIDFHSNTDLEQ